MRIGLVMFSLLVAHAAAARTLTVGDTLEFRSPSAAIAAAAAGDVVHIAAGEYFDCAVVRQDRLTIEGDGFGSVLTDKICGGKALLVIDGKDVTVRNLTLQRARVIDGNGAGIRAEGGNLTVDGVRFFNNQDGLLAAANPAAAIRILRSEFTGNGACQNESGCAHGIYVDAVALLHIEASRFDDTHVGHDVKSKAARTEIIGSSIEDGPTGTSSYLVDVPIGGSLLIDGCTMEKGANSSNRSVAISIGEEGVSQRTGEIVVRETRFTNDMKRSTVFVRNVTATPVQLIGDKLIGAVRPLEGDGSTQ